MTDRKNVVAIIDFFETIVRNKSIDGSKLSEDQVDEYMGTSLQMCAIMGKHCSPEEEEQARNEIKYTYRIRSDPGQSILSDYDQGEWYTDRRAEIDEKFWERYRDYLLRVKKYPPTVVSVLNDSTLNRTMMNCLLDPNVAYGGKVMKRGLAIGDVQSGKTSTYIGLMCKAADAGYKVFIVLTGTIEQLRRQTQERIEEGFIGYDSTSDENDKRVGVGRTGQGLHVVALTSRLKDFTGQSNQTVMSLQSLKDPIVFVIKKNKTSLEKLISWLRDQNTDVTRHISGSPMLMIDDEADNASVNTSGDKENPTTINRKIRELADLFAVSNYVGFTATPFANVFIDPETTEEMETQDLFPENFILTLPAPSNYIGANQVFAPNGKYHGQLVYIRDVGRDEEDGFSYYYRHRTDWRGELPDSLTDAVYAFYIVNTIRDLRGGSDTHRSMMINITSYMDVQEHVGELVEQIHNNSFNALYKLSRYTAQTCLTDPVLRRIHRIWEEHYSGIEYTWEDVAEQMRESVQDIQIKVVNSKSNERLTYPKKGSLRVIVIGGLTLSRGMTLEGLAISYFCRGTNTYDVLMQMGRWFGYRKGYEDLFRVWILKTTAEWYAEIADATQRLKDDMTEMRDQRKKPREFGIRVKDDYEGLQITARNKMRNTDVAYESLSYFGSLIETPYVMSSPDAQRKNFSAVRDLVQMSVRSGIVFEKPDMCVGGKGRYMLKNVPKKRIAQLMGKITIPSKYSTRFDTEQITSFLEETDDPSIASFDVAFMEGSESAEKLDFEGKMLRLVERKTSAIDSDLGRIRIGRHGKLGGTGDGVAGISAFGGRTAEDILNDAKESFRKEYRERKGKDYGNDEYPSDTWFRHIKDRNPLLLVYFLDVSDKDGDDIQTKQFEKLKSDLDGVPVVGFALGFPKNDSGGGTIVSKYRQNSVYSYYGEYCEEDFDGGEE